MSESTMESFQERQDNECEVLQAVFMDDFVDISKGDHRNGMDIKLHLTPQQGMSGCGSAYVTVDMSVSCPPKYPEVMPTIALEKEKGLSTEKMKQVSKEVNSLAKKLKGEVMILELAQHVQAFLYAHNVPGYKSFYEEMMSNQRREQEKRRQLQRKREEKEQREINEEIMRREAMKEEMKRKKELTNKEKETSEEPVSDFPEKTKDVHSTPVRVKRQPDPVDVGSDNKDRSRTESESRALANDTDNGTPNSRQIKARRQKADGHNTGVVTTVFTTKTTERVVNRGQVIGCNDKGSNVYMYVGMDSRTGELVTLKEWILKWKRGKGRKPLPDEEKDAENCLKQLVPIEQELISLLRLEHVNLVHYLAMKHTPGKEAITVELLMEYIQGGSLDLQALQGSPVPLDILRHYTKDLLEALVYLHGRGVVHKNLQASSVYVDSHGCLRLADYSVCKRLDDLNESIQAGSHSVRFSDEKTYGGRGGKKGDILKLGILLLELIQATPGVQYPCDIPHDIPAELQDLLQRCLDPDERNRSSAASLLDHPFIKPSLSSSLLTTNIHNDLNSSVGTDKETEISIPEPQSYDIHLGHSRLRSEFEVLDFLGKGGFGSVTKVLNKLDGNVYAIKRILLNPKSRELNRKITREVKLLSRLNHENVVRYFNSWIEVAETPPSTETDSDSVATVTNTTTASTNTKDTPSDKTNQPATDKNSLGMSDDIEKLAPKVSFSSLEWSASHDTGGLDTSDDSTSDEGDVFGMSFMPGSDSSDCIEFEHSNSCHGDSADSFKKEKGKEPSDAVAITDKIEPSQPLQYLYIQMEFCEKSTLRTAIDQGLYQDERRIWRYLREIVEGLAHIHSQGMIHRDLKPVNIFLDSNDLVKIGDFGLATAGNMGTAALPDIPQQDLHEAQPLQDGSAGTGSHLTGKVGTALYVSPELCQARSSHYNQKVDLYSLGIIFFEMCSPPLATGMERVQIIGKIRQKNLQFPDSFDEVKHENKSIILRWLLNHDPEVRPTAQELLQSEHLPPAQMENTRLQEMLRHTIANSQSKAYRHIMQELFSQKVPAAADFTYDMDMHKGFSLKSFMVQQAVYEILCKIFRKHSAVRVNTPLLLPRNRDLETSEMYVNLMTHSGGLVSLAYDLRVPFARFVARNNITNMKRYCIERVFREKQIYGCHPRELTECAFDIVASSAVGLIPDAEILHVVSEIINEFPVLQARNYSIRLNHTSLLTAVLNHCGIPEDKHRGVYKILSDARTEKLAKLQIQTRLCSLSLSEQQVRSLYSYIELEGHHSKVAGTLKPLVNSKGPVGSMVKEGLHELEAIISQAQVFGIRLEMIVTLSLVYNIHCFSGAIFQFVAEPVHRKKKTAMEVLAAGGRYDQLVQHFKKRSASQQHPGWLSSAVGISVSFEKIVTAVLQDTSGMSDMTPSICDVLVCPVGNSASLKDRIKIVRDLWASGLRADIVYDSTMPLEDIEDYCRAVNISHLVLLKDCNEKAKIRVFDKEKQVGEQRVDFHCVVGTLNQMFSTSKTETPESLPQTSVMKPPTIEVAPTSKAVNYNVTFVPRPEIGLRKRHERVIQSKIQPFLDCISSKTKVEVVAVDLPLAVVKNMVAVLDFDNGEVGYTTSVSALRDMHVKYKKTLAEICDVLQHLKLDGGVPFIVLYSYKEDNFKAIY